MSEAIELRDDVLRIERINASQESLFDRATVIYDSRSTLNSVSGNRFYRISSLSGESIYDNSCICMYNCRSSHNTQTVDIMSSPQTISTECSIKILPEDYLDGAVETVSLSQREPVRMPEHSIPQTALPHPAQNNPNPMPAQPANNMQMYQQPVNKGNENIKFRSALAFVLALIGMVSFVSGISVVFSVASIVVALNNINKLPQKGRGFLYISIVIASLALFLSFVSMFLI